jgi:hypothetical protein
LELDGALPPDQLPIVNATIVTGAGVGRDVGVLRDPGRVAFDRAVERDLLSEREHAREVERSAQRRDLAGELVGDGLGPGLGREEEQGRERRWPAAGWIARKGS